MTAIARQACRGRLASKDLTHYPLGLLKRLDEAVEQNPIETAVTEVDVIPVVLIEGVHPDIPTLSARGGGPQAWQSARLGQAPGMVSELDLRRAAEAD
jgi:hypothetical protein